MKLRRLFILVLFSGAFLGTSFSHADHDHSSSSTEHVCIACVKDSAKPIANTTGINTLDIQPGFVEDFAIYHSRIPALPNTFLSRAPPAIS